MQQELARQIIGWKQSHPTWTGDYDYFQSGSLVEGELSSAQLFNPLDLAPILTAEEVVEHVFGSPLLLERLCEADWLVPLSESPEEPCFATSAVCMALARLRRGEKPPRMASEPEPLTGDLEIGQIAKWRHFKVGKAAELLGVSPRSLSDAAQKGEIPFLQFRKHRLFNLDDVIAYLEKHTPKSGITAGDIARILR